MKVGLIVSGENVQISDGFHTFEELYDHRIALWIALCRQFTGAVWRARIHSDGTEICGWFVLGMHYRYGRQITYHLPDSKWNDTDFAETLERAPEFDGHSSMDVLNRLASL